MATVKSIKSGTKPPPSGLRVNIALQPSVDAQVFYSNFLEVAHGPHDLTIYGVRVPAKLRHSDMAAAVETGEMQLEPDFQIVISPTLAPGLIRALQAQVELWEKEFGKANKEGGDEDNK